MSTPLATGGIFLRARRWGRELKMPERPYKFARMSFKGREVDLEN